MKRRVHKPGSPAKKVMLVDDSVSLRQYAGLALRAAGYHVVEGRDGIDALNILNTPEGKDIRLIISDVNMPNMDGITLLREIKKSPDHYATPVLILTTESHSHRKAEGRAAGASAWATKPFNSRHLVHVVSRLMAD